MIGQGFIGNQPKKMVSSAPAPLVILNGQTVLIAAGSLHTYSSVNIHAGGTLKVPDSSSGAWAKIICQGLFTWDGDIDYQNCTGIQTFNDVAPRGTVLSYVGDIGAGGKGGDTIFNLGGNASNGCGGGGAGFDPGGNASSAHGGDGSAGFSDEEVSGGEGASGYGSSGNSGSTVDQTGGGINNVYGAGGGGGTGGAHGGGIYIDAQQGFSPGSSGNCRVNGQNGGDGGHGGSALGALDNNVGAGGGGGGGGGYGGAVIIDYHGTPPTSVNFIVDTGVGRPGGDGGGTNGSGSQDNGDGLAGDGGSDGVPGSVTLNSY